MASRSGAGSGGNSQNRLRSAPDDFPPLGDPGYFAPLRMPSAGQRSSSARETASSRGPSSFDLSSSQSGGAVAANPRPVTSARHYSTAARRAERIRNLDDRALSLDELASSSMDRWFTSRRPLRLRPIQPPSLHYPFQGPPNLEEIDHSLDEANAQLRSLLDMTNQINLMTPLLSSTMSPTSRSHDFPDDNIRNKRRKIDSSRLLPSSKGFRYGRYGQVEPGRLQMEMVSCDGGMFSNESSYAAENILKDDTSVYCTKSNRCNIVLRHKGATVFTVDELIIKAPASMNYSHPVREGMVFIAMNQDDILTRTAQYPIQYVPSSHHRPWHPLDQDSRNSGSGSSNNNNNNSGGGNGSSSGNNNNNNNHNSSSRSSSHQVSETATPRHIISIRHHDDGSTSTRYRRSIPPPPQNDEVDRRIPDMPPEFTANQPDVQITTDCASDDEDEDLELLRSSRPPNRIGSLPFETEISESDSLPPTNFPHSIDEDPFDYHLTESFHRQLPSISTAMNLSYYHDREREREAERVNPSLAEARDAHASATQEAIRAVGGELLVPHARFSIVEKKSRCTIRFDPPVSGRFILLKMWSPCYDPLSNIDIQTVVAKGFAGPRYFPSVQMS